MCQEKLLFQVIWEKRHEEFFDIKIKLGLIWLCTVLFYHDLFDGLFFLNDWGSILNGTGGKIC